MVTSTGHWHSLTSSLPFNCPKSSTSLRGARAKPKAGLQFNFQKWPVLEFVGAFLAKKSHLDTKPYSHQGDRNAAEGTSASVTDSRREGS